MDLLHAYSNQPLGSASAEGVAAAARKSARRATEAPAVRRARQFREEEVAALIAFYREHGSVAATAKVFGITRQTAGKCLAHAGVPTIRRMSALEIALARELWDAGDTASSIARRIGFSPHTIVRALREQ